MLRTIRLGIELYVCVNTYVRTHIHTYAHTLCKDESRTCASHDTKYLHLQEAGAVAGGEGHALAWAWAFAYLQSCLNIPILSSCAQKKLALGAAVAGGQGGKFDQAQKIDSR